MATTVLIQPIFEPLGDDRSHHRLPSLLSMQIGNSQEDRDTRLSSNDVERTTGAWLCVLGAFTFVIPSFGFMQSLGTLQSYLQSNQLDTYSTSDVGWIPGIYLFLSYCFTIQIGPICDHYGPMAIGPAGIVITVASFLLLAECKAYWQFMLCFGVIGSLGGAILGTLAVSAVAKLFHRQRGLAIGLTLVGSAVGGIIFPMLLRSTLGRLGWKWSMRITALVIAGIVVPGLLCFIPTRRHISSDPSTNGPSRRGRTVINFSAFKSFPFSFVTLGSFLLEFAIYGIAGLLPTIATSTGFSQEDSFTLLAIVGACSCLGRALPGMLSDIVGPFNSLLIMITITLLSMVTLFIPFASNSHAVLYAFSALWGFGSGSFLSVTPVCLGRTCEAKDYGRFYGTMSFAVSFSVLLAVPLSGLLLDTLGSRALSGLLTAVVFFGGVCYVAARALVVGKLLSPKIKV